MYIIIAGGGIAGTAVASLLVEKKHDVVVIDRDRERCEHVYAEIGAISINGNAADINTLKEAGIEKADVAIGALYRDSDNLTFAILAHSFHVKRIMVKMREPAYRDVYKMAGVSTICNMTALFKQCVLMELENPNIRIISNLEDRHAQLIMVRYPATEKKDGISIMELAKKDVFAKNCVFAGIFNKEAGKIIMPRGSDRVRPGDKLFLVADAKQVPQISKHLLAMETGEL